MAISVPQRPVARINQDAWFLRLYLWMWKADLEHVDFCRLFWGYVFAIPNLIVRAFIFPFWAIYRGSIWSFRKLLPIIERAGDKMGDAAMKMLRGLGKVLDFLGNVFPEPDSTKAAVAVPKRRFYQPPAPKPREPGKLRKALKKWRKNAPQQFLTVASTSADKTVATVQNIWPVVRWFFIAVGAIFAIAMAGLTGYLIYLIISVMPAIGNGLWAAISWTGNGIGFLATVCWPWMWLLPALIGVIAGALLFGALVVRAIQTEHAKRAGKTVSRGTMSFGGAMKTGVKSVKHRTCPVIEVVEDSPGA